MPKSTQENAAPTAAASTGRAVLRGVPAAMALMAGGTAAAALALPVALARTPGTDAELIRLCDRIVALEADYAATCSGKRTRAEEKAAVPRLEAISEEITANMTLIYDLRPKTLAGLQAMASAAHAGAQQDRDGEMLVDCEADWLASAVIAHLAGKTA